MVSVWTPWKLQENRLCVSSNRLVCFVMFDRAPFGVFLNDSEANIYKTKTLPNLNGSARPSHWSPSTFSSDPKRQKGQTLLCLLCPLWAHPVVRQCPKLFPPLIPSDIMPSSYGESVTQTKNGGILKMPVSVTIELVKRGFRKNGGRFGSRERESG